MSAGAASEQADVSKPHATTFTEEDILRAWEILSPSGQSVMTKGQVLDSVKRYLPHMTAREVRELVGTGNMTLDKLRNLLFNTPMPPEFDANAEAFKLLDPGGTGMVDMSTLRRLLLQIPGIDSLDEDDMKVIMQVADDDGDGKISLEDFEKIGSWAPPQEQASEAVKKMLMEKASKPGR